MCCNNTSIFCTDPSIDPPQRSVASTVTGRGMGSSYGCFKPENQNVSSCCGGGDAIEGSPRAKWEEKYGKLKTVITKIRKPVCNGMTTGMTEVIQRIPEAPENTTNKRVSSCCSIRYKACPINC